MADRIPNILWQAPLMWLLRRGSTRPGPDQPIGALLATLPSDERVAAATACLPYANDETRDLLAAEILEAIGRAPTREGIRRLAGVFDQLPLTAKRGAVALLRGQWAPAAQLGTDRRPGARAALATLAGHADEPELVEQLATLVADPDARVRAAGVASLSRLGHPDRQAGDSMARVLARLLDDPPEPEAEAIVRIAASALAAPGCPSAIESRLTDKAHPAHALLRSLLRRSKDPEVSGWAVRWASRPGLVGPALDRLGREPDEQSLSITLSLSHLLCAPDRVGPVRKAFARGTLFVPSMHRLSTLPVPARRAGARWIGTLATPPAKGERLLGMGLIDPDPSVRHACVRALISCAPASTLVRDFCFDPDARVASTALAGLMTRAGNDAGARRETAARLVRSPSARVRTLATRFMRAERSGAREALAQRPTDPTDRAALIRQLRKNLRDLDPRISADAARLAARLGVVTDVELELSAVLSDASRPDSPRIECARALRHSASDTSGEALRLTGSDPSGPVAAGALRALFARRDSGELSRALDERLPSPNALLTDDDPHRREVGLEQALRAGEHERIADVIEPVLTDGRPAHVLAGLRCLLSVDPTRVGSGATKLAPVLERLAGSDDEGIARVARRCFTRIKGSIVARWSGGPRPLVLELTGVPSAEGGRP